MFFCDVASSHSNLIWCLIRKAFLDGGLCCVCLYEPHQVKGCFRACAKCTYSDSIHACAKSNLGICSQLIHSIVANNSASGQGRPWSDCADAQADLGLRCPHMLEDTFSLGAAHILVTSKEYKIYESCATDTLPDNFQLSKLRHSLFSFMIIFSMNGRFVMSF